MILRDCTIMQWRPVYLFLSTVRLFTSCLSLALLKPITLPSYTRMCVGDPHLLQHTCILCTSTYTYVHAHTRSRASLSFPYRRAGVTLGVHTTRLLRLVFSAWVRATVDARMVGKATSFNGLDHFFHQVLCQTPVAPIPTSAVPGVLVLSMRAGMNMAFKRCTHFECTQDGGLAEWFPCGRLRRQEIEIKSEKLGSGTFAEVCASRVLAWNTPQRPVMCHPMSS
jgi:hypothetical protein